MASEETFGPSRLIYKFDHEDQAIAPSLMTPNMGWPHISTPMIFREPSVFMRPLDVDHWCQYGNHLDRGGTLRWSHESGLGREGGPHGIEEFLEIKYGCIGIKS